MYLDSSSCCGKSNPLLVQPNSSNSGFQHSGKSNCLPTKQLATPYSRNLGVAEYTATYYDPTQEIDQQLQEYLVWPRGKGLE